MAHALGVRLQEDQHLCACVCASLNAHNVDSLAFLPCLWTLVLDLQACSQTNSFRRHPLAAYIFENVAASKSWLSTLAELPREATSPPDWGILVKAPRTRKKNIKSVFSGVLVLKLRFAMVLTLIVSKEASPHLNTVLRSVGPFSRYVSRVLVHDLARDQKWHFLCNSWLSIDVGDCVLDKVFPVATEKDRKQFRYFFFCKQILFILFFRL